MRPPDGGSPPGDDPRDDATAGDPRDDWADLLGVDDGAGGDAASDARDEASGPPATRADGAADDPPAVTDTGAFVAWLATTDHGGVSAVREMVTTAAVVLLVGAVLFGVSGIWPPMVAVESGSMTPHMQAGDLVFVMDEQRLKPAAAHGDTGVVTYRAGKAAGYRTFRSYGDVIVYRPDGSRTETPIIHRAHFWVEEGENWYQTKADPEYVGRNYRNCEQLPNCPAPHAGFVTKGDNNDHYDQIILRTGPVRPEWITGTAEFRIPWLGCIRLAADDLPANCLAVPQRIPGSWLVLGALAVLAFAASAIDR